ncbi:SusD/RagB family nutrient-binding outer membrane lipoprotein [Litoribacter alkaliphilus]|uniref:SusD/RagB family nutrient-binding outer membrane lipoprotein n=1 Tax=Litoribacter ruber TaxID=702568 RepID=A0AAP2CIC5_9BACT|nr:SusD/RagB family nutrient-binding outer membrane lipoprotein [Litoribacter alkaliphilus]MBS9523811.1 SusD/RagB family nutrient-binding outer membrane lipoprotein [Litoribacter alkaliphilus]
MKRYICFIYLLFTLASCEGFLDVNENPNAPIASNLPLSAKLSGALVSTSNQETLQINQIGGFWGGYWGTNNDGTNLFFDLKTYNGPSLRSQREGIPVWENGFNNILFFSLIQEEAELSSNHFYVGTSKVMQGWLFLRLVDFYGNIPFDEAGQGNEKLQPRYEDGQVVYQKAINLITSGIADLKQAGPVPATNGDVMFNGNVDSWIKFANTVKLRALLRQSELGNEAYIQEQLALISQEGSGFIQHHAQVNPGYLNTTGKMNPFWETYYRDVQGNATANYQNLRPTEFLISQMQDRNDPRLSRLYQAIDGEYKGVVFGNSDAGNPKYDRVNTSAFLGAVENGGPTGLFRSFNQPSIVMSSFESFFLQAEAAQRGWIGGSASDLYNQAIQESFQLLTVPAMETTAYLSQQEVALERAEDPIRRIIEQKWLALNSISSIEAWNDYRRLGWPEYPATAASGVVGRPNRLMYPETERGTNLEQVLAQGNDMINEKIWWSR